MAPQAIVADEELQLHEGLDDASLAEQTRIQAPAPMPKGEAALVPLPVGMDWGLFATVIALMVVGLVMAYSASVWLGLNNFKGNDEHFLHKHVGHLVAGVFALLVAVRTPYQLYRKVAYPLLGLAMLLLVAVLKWGVVVNASRRWLFGFQVAELAKFAFVVYLAHALTKQISRKNAHKFSIGFLPHAVVWLIAFALLMKEPDLGSGIVLAVLLFAMTFIAGTNFAYIFPAAGLGLTVLIAYVLHDPMRGRRFWAFIAQVKSVLGIEELPMQTIRRPSYQWFNGHLAVASGGLFGKGLGMSEQKLGFVPECHTDWVLSIIAEEFGLIGVALIAIAFLFLVIRGLRIATRARDEFGRLLASGITILFGTQVAVNFGVVMGTLPTKGLTLPFVSYGGSSILVLAIAAGTLLNIGRGGDPDAGWPDWRGWLRRLRKEDVRATARSGNTRVIIQGRPASRAVTPAHGTLSAHAGSDPRGGTP